jgi:hypothetical protein
MLMGLAIGLCGVIQTAWMLVVAGIVVVGSMCWIVIYSYVIWRNDPEKLSAVATAPAPNGNDAL